MHRHTVTEVSQAQALASSHFVPEPGTSRLLWKATRAQDYIGWEGAAFEPADGQRAAAERTEPVAEVSEQTQDDLVLAISRSGSADEVAQGPLLYSLVLLLAVVCGWHNRWGVCVTVSCRGGDGPDALLMVLSLRLAQKVGRVCYCVVSCLRWS